MILRQEVMNKINKIPDDKLKEVDNYLSSLIFKKKGGKEIELDKEQKQLLELLNYTINTGRGDFAEKHDHYLYGKSKQ